MTRVYIFSDEAGDFVFRSNGRASKYFIVCTIALADCEVGNKLLELRRDMVYRGLPAKDWFHATEDKQIVRSEVYDLISRYEFKIDATILEKSKAQPQTRVNEARFYQYAWYYHLKNQGAEIFDGKTEALITAAAIGTKKGQAVYTSAVNDVLQQTIHRQHWATTFPKSAAEPCLQVVDYCAWAIQRKWERGDVRSYNLIADKIRREYDLFERGRVHYY
ncbi:DUF3800 domain-containing protein [Hyphococcus sp. DH-69]|uniref:DUF3800 domain-containing protein n=1 Tax=Hyphococcus formosus TaxID=3143534 RepID=UPI00398A791E